MKIKKYSKRLSEEWDSSSKEKNNIFLAYLI